MPEEKKSKVFDKTNTTLLLVSVAAVGLATLIVQTTPGRLPLVNADSTQGNSAAGAGNSSTSAARKIWAASAPGRIEPNEGAVNFRPEASGRVIEVYISEGEQVSKDMPLAKLRDDEPRARLEQARAEVAVRLGERDEEPEKDKLVIERRMAADNLAKAERELHNAVLALDETFLKRRAGNATDADVAAARQVIETAESSIEDKRKVLEEQRRKVGMALPTRLDSGLTLARADLRLAEIAFENTRVRAPVEGTLLEFDAKVGEMTSPTVTRPLAVIGDMSTIQVTAEVQERDVSKVRLGQAVIVRSNAFDGTEFTGKVTEIAPTVGSPGLRSQGPRQQLDAEVLEVKIQLDGVPPVRPGMRVDVFFKSQQEVSAILPRKK